MSKRFSITTVAAVLFATLAPAAAETIDFEQAGAVGAAPKDFTIATTGKGKPAEWKLQPVQDAPSGKLAILQASNDPTGNRFPLLVYDKITARNADISVKFKAVSGREDQAAGIVWRFIDKNNYYIVRANALEDNVVTYIVKNGVRTDLPVKGKGKTYGAKAPIPKNSWSTLAVSVAGDLFKISLNGKLLYEVEDKTFANPGKIGLWTKADSVMLFDDLTIDKPE